MVANANSMFFYSQVKGRMQDALIALGFRSLIVFKPALLVGTREEIRLVEHIATKVLVPLSHLLPLRTQKRLMTNVETLAVRMLAEGKAAVAGVHVIPAVDI